MACLHVIGFDFELGDSDWSWFQSLHWAFCVWCRTCVLRIEQTALFLVQLESDCLGLEYLSRICKDYCQCDCFWSGFHKQGLVCHTLFYKVERNSIQLFWDSRGTIVAACHCLPRWRWWTYSQEGLCKLISSLWLMSIWVTCLVCVELVSELTYAYISQMLQLASQG